jgi:hypothetical protein
MSSQLLTVLAASSCSAWRTCGPTPCDGLRGGCSAGPDRLVANAGQAWMLVV